MMHTFICLIRLSDPRIAENPSEAEQRILSAHFHYLEAATKAGQTLLVGPCTDFAFGVVVFRAQDEAEAKAFVEADPSVKEGVMVPELHPFRISLLSEAINREAREIFSHV